MKDYRNYPASHRRALPRAFYPWLLLALLVAACLPAAPPTHGQGATVEPSLFGMNMYITGRERTNGEARALLSRAREIGASWSREELSWASWGDRARNTFYDERIGMLADARINIIGMLLTTPEDQRDPACEAHAEATNQPAYWCAPTNMQAYADWAALVVERYDGDGTDDAPGSPRIAVWQIWNEPDQDGTWLPQADPVAYGTMLRLAYAAIKQADPSALVLSGGVMTFDSIGVNAFMDRVVEVAGWDSFDALALHPWLIDHAPDDPTLINPREGFDVTIPGRLALAQRWVAARGGKPIWITEVGWSVCGDQCAPQFAKTRAQQADYMVRTFVLAAAAGVAHVSYFQLEDKFDGGQVPWGQAAILTNDLQPSDAFYAYGTMVQLLQYARYVGTGALHAPGVRAHYRFAEPNGTRIDVLWRISGSETLSFPLTAGLLANRVARDGATTPLQGAVAAIPVSEQPVYVHQAQPTAARFFAETGFTVSAPFLPYWEQNGGLERLGLPISPQRSEPGTDGRDYPTQWFERARLEHHPQNAPPYDVLLGLLGIEALRAQDIDWRDLPTAEPSQVPAACRYFAETQHSLCPPFLAYWQQNGGLPVFGFPVSEPFPEESADDGQIYTVQYFERNRLEHHPQNAPPFDVLLGRLGAELLPR